MNRGIVVMNTILWSLVAIILIIILISSIGGRIWGRQNNLSSSSSVYEYTVKDDIENISIDWVSGDITVSVYDELYIKLEQYVSTAVTEDTKMSVLVTGKSLKISDNRSKRWNFLWFGNMYSTSIVVFLPQKVYNDIFINGVSSRIEITDISASEIKTHTVSGKINLKNVSAPNLDMNVISGKLYAQGAFSDVDSQSVSGSVEIHSSTMLQRLRSNSVSGRVTVYIPENEGFSVRFSKVSGKLTSDFPFMTKGAKEYIYGNGAAQFSIDVVSGNCSIYKK